MSDLENYSRLMLSCCVSEVARASLYKTSKATDNLKKVDSVIISHDPAQGSFSMRILNKDKLGEYFASESSRFWLASMFSLMRSSQKQEKNAAWQVIEAYYASYFAVQFIIRMTGRSISHLDSSLIQKIKTNNLTGMNFTPSSGLYLVEYQDFDNVKFKPLPKGGGSHKQAWNAWETTITDLIGCASRDIAEYAAQSIALIEHRQKIQSGSHATPSDIRSEINYQFKGKLWPFEEQSAPIMKKISNIIAGNEEISMTKINRPEQLISSSRYILYLAYSMVKTVTTRYPQSILSKSHNLYRGNYLSTIENIKI